MELDEVLSVQSQDCASFNDRCVQDDRITDTSARLPRLMNRQDVVTQNAQRFYDGDRKVFVCEEPGHRSGLLVLPDLKVNIRTVGAHVRPSVDQILGSQRGITTE